jgi:predicted MFS family arabinose efflux permease
LRSGVGESAIEEIHAMILPRFCKSVGTAEPSEPAASCRANKTLFTLAALQFIGFVDFMIIMPLGPQLLADLGVDARGFSWVVSAHTLAAGLAGFLAAPLLDRGSRKRVYIIVATGLLAGTAACGASGSLPLLLAARCITGAFSGVLGGLSLTIVAEMFPAERRGRALGTLMSAFAVASVAGVPLGIALGTSLGWQAPFFALALLGIPLVGLAAWLLPPLPAPVDGSRRHYLAHLFEVVLEPSHRRAYALIALLMVGAFSVIPFISTALVANVGVTGAQLPIVFVAGGLLALFTTPLIGRLVDRIGGPTLFRTMVLASAAMMLVLTHLPAVGIVGAAPVVAGLMAANAGRMVTAMSLITASITPRARGSFMSVNSSVQQISIGMGAALGGMIVEGGAGEPLRHFGTVGIVAAGATISSLWLAARIRPTA